MFKMGYYFTKCIAIGLFSDCECKVNAKNFIRQIFSYFWENILKIAKE